MNYLVTHKTNYFYSATAPLSFNQLRLRPRTFNGQNCLQFHFRSNPHFSFCSESIDFFGNSVLFFSVQEDHKILQVEAESLVDVKNISVLGTSHSLTWENVRENMTLGQIELALEARQFLYDSPFIKRSAELANYALPSFAPGRSFIEAIMDLTTRIHQDFTYAPNETHIKTPLPEILHLKKGVCQDFAHIGIGCLRSLGIPARYVSGYLETLPPEGKEKLVGSDASHAWFSVPVPSIGWLDFDPTNNLILSNRHITIGWGRDYGDVMPLNGIYWGNGLQTLSVSVDVARQISM